SPGQNIIKNKSRSQVNSKFSVIINKKEKYYEAATHGTGKTLGSFIFGIDSADYDTGEFNAHSDLAGYGTGIGHFKTAIQLYYYVIFGCSYFSNSCRRVFIRPVWEEKGHYSGANHYRFGRVSCRLGVSDDG